VPQDHRFEITVTDSPAVLDRIVGVCRSRQCAIVSLHFQAADRHRPGHVSVTMDGTARMARLAADRLHRLVDVVAVESGGGLDDGYPPGRRAIASTSRSNP
jgi:acetolactate synthase small subunit